MRLRPGVASTQVQRAFVFYDLRRFEDAGRHLRSAYFVDSSSERANRLTVRVVQGLSKEGEQHRLA